MTVKKAKQKSPSALRKEVSRQKNRDAGLERFSMPEIWGTEKQHKKFQVELTKLIAETLKGA